MPITKSAKKALRGSARKREFNAVRKEALKQAVKGLRKTVSAGAGDAAAALSAAYQAIDKAAKRGIIKKNAAARKKSRLTKIAAKGAK